MKHETTSRVTPHLKRHGSAKKSMPDAKRQRSRKSPAVTATTTTTTTTPPKPAGATTASMEWEEQITRLDPNDPVQAKRIQQRRKMLMKGKNTAGYDRYLQQVPKHKRIPRSMTTPSTPDPTVDISNKRWQGQVRAWRVALHNYDPPDLVNTSIALSSSSSSSTKENNDDSVEEFQTPCKPTSNNNATADDSPISIISDTSRRDLNGEFAAASPRPTLITGASGWGSDSDDDDVDDLL